MLKLNRLWDYVKIWYSSRAYKTKLIPAAQGWYAVYKTDDSYKSFPLVVWEVYCYKDVPLESVGLIFEDNKPPTLQHADDLDNFVGYQMRITGGSSQLFSVPCYENN